jgi:hypothetical protein
MARKQGEYKKPERSAQAPRDMYRQQKTYTSSGCLPVYRDILCSSGYDIGVPRTSTDLDILIVDLGLLAIDVPVLGLRMSARRIRTVGEGDKGLRTGRTNRDILFFGLVDRLGD